MKMKRLLSILLSAVLLLSLLSGMAVADGDGQGSGDSGSTPAAGIYMSINGVVPGDYVSPPYAMNYSSNSQTQFVFYYYDADATNFYPRRTTIELVSVSVVSSNLWMVTLNSGVSGDHSMLFNAMKSNGSEAELTMQLTDLTPPTPPMPDPVPEEIYTALDGTGAPDINSLVQANQGPGPKYALSYTPLTAKTFYYYNQAVNEVSPGMGTAVEKIGDHLWAITMKAGFKGEFTWLFSLDNGEELGIYFYDGSETPGGWIPDYKPVQNSSYELKTATPEIESAPLGLQKFKYEGNDYYFGFVESISEGGSSGRDGAVYAMLEPNIYTFSDSRYQPVSGDLRTALQTYLGAITLKWYVEEGSEATAAPAHYTCTEECTEPSEYYWRFADENVGVWYLTATTSTGLCSVAKYGHYKSNEIVTNYVDNAETLQQALDELAESGADFDNTTYIFKLTANFEGDVTIPPEIKDLEINGNGGNGNNRITWIGGIYTGENADERNRPLVQNINFVSGTPGSGSAIYGKRSVNVQFCDFTGFDSAINLKGPAYVSGCVFKRNQTGVYVAEISSLYIDNCTFEENHTGLWLKDLPKTAILNNYVIKWNSFKNNTIAVKCNWGNANRPFFMPYNYFNGNQTQSSGKIYTYPESKDAFFREYEWGTGGSISNEGDYSIPTSALTQTIAFDILDSVSGEVMGKWNFGGGNG